MPVDDWKKVIKEIVIRVPAASDDSRILVAHVAVVLDLPAKRLFL